MPIAINGSGTITGISAGGLPDGCIVTADIVDNNITEAKIANGAVTQAKRSEQLTLGTAQASTSGTAIDFTSIPSWVKRVTVIFNGVSTNGTSNILIQLGTSGGVANTGYLSSGSGISSVVGTSSSTAGFLISDDSSNSSAHTGLLTFAASGNVWHQSGSLRSLTGKTSVSGGSVTLSGTLDRIRITTVNGTDTFDAGSINIMYE